jgi:competence protein ComEA
VIGTDSLAEENVQETEEDSSQEKLNINSATKEELMSVDGIGETIASRILMKREELGGFKIIEQITEVDGIGQKTFDKIKKYLTVE